MSLKTCVTLNDFINHIKVRIHEDWQKIQYYQMVCSFDIETTSTYVNGLKIAYMYVWQFGMDDYCIIGRTWQEFNDLMQALKQTLWLSDKRYLTIWVHNLSYEFQFIQGWFKWSNVFALDNREVVRATTTDGFEFRCSYKLSGLSLEKTAENLTKHIINKKVGDLDYRLIRNSKTPLSSEEIDYCISDIEIVIDYINEELDEYKYIEQIPMTNTGKVRLYCRSKCFGIDEKGKWTNKEYKELMHELTINPLEYLMCKRAFQGGFVHCSALMNGLICACVISKDFTSSYPAVMLSEMFPMSKGQYIKIESEEQFYQYLETYCCVFDIKFHNLRPKFKYENILSESKCWDIKNKKVNNGRLYSCDECSTTITNVDFDSLQQFYEWDSFEVGNFIYYKRGYLPKEIILCIAEFYQKKTTLKGLKDKVDEYLKNKGMLNSIYGMIVTDILRDIIEYKDGWQEPKKPDLQKAIDDYNKNRNRFLFYPWGIFVTSYARNNLYTGILELEDDYIYSDTDSVKYMNKEKHEAYFEKYNELITKKIKKMCEHYDLDYEMFEPKTVKGVKKPIGVWDDDGEYDRFKTLGAKRYLVEENGEYELTVSGLNKDKAIKYMITQGDVFQQFKDGLYIPAEYSGRIIATYFDKECSGTITDYLGNEAEYYEKSYVHMEQGEYNLDESNEYIKFIGYFYMKEIIK